MRSTLPTPTKADTGALPTLVIIGAMKAGTTALHRYLDAHPQVAMSSHKELNFFNGPTSAPAIDPSQWWMHGQWHRGVGWYRQQFDATATARGESSPAYTSPSFPEVAARMASIVPQARLLYLVREPFSRALSQYAHHRRDGAERRPPEEALLDPESQYVARSRYVERLRPFLARFDRSQLHVVVQERLRSNPAAELRGVLTHIGVDPDAVDAEALAGVPDERNDPPEPPTALATRFRRLVADEVAHLQEMLDDPLPEWESSVRRGWGAQDDA